MDRDIAVALLDQLHAAQNKFYGGGDALVRDLSASGIAGTVPGLFQGRVEEALGEFAGR